MLQMDGIFFFQVKTKAININNLARAYLELLTNIQHKDLMLHNKKINSIIFKTKDNRPNIKWDKTNLIYAKVVKYPCYSN